MATRKKTAMTTIEISTPRHAAQMYAGALLSSRKRPGVVRALKPVTYVRPAVTLDAAQVAAYAKVCGFKPEAGVPVLYPQMLTFPLAMEFFASEHCPWPAMGTVHLANRIEQHGALHAGDAVRVELATGDLFAHEKGQVFTLNLRILRGGDLVWSATQSLLRVGVAQKSGAAYASQIVAEAPLSCQAEFFAPADMGRRYGAVSGDRNPIHLAAMTAKLFGFKRAIAHGMWTQARALSCLLPPQPLEQASLDVEFKTPLYLPGRATLWSARAQAGALFEVRDAKGTKPHLRGELRY